MWCGSLWRMSVGAVTDWQGDFPHHVLVVVLVRCLGHVFPGRAADRTSRLDVFEEVHLPTMSFLKTIPDSCTWTRSNFKDMVLNYVTLPEINCSICLWRWVGDPSRKKWRRSVLTLARPRTRSSLKITNNHSSVRCRLHLASKELPMNFASFVTRQILSHVHLV